MSTRTEPLRGDIQGLRALAVTLVVLFHLWPNRLSGGYIGVDVFFVISGFLITSHLVSRPPRNLAGIGEFWARRIRRLLPASFLVLGVTAIASRLLAPETQWASTARDLRAATLYVLNWRLAENSVDYLAADDAPSPAQHFWSLSVEEQFYIGWPIIIALLVALAVTLKVSRRTILLTGMIAVTAASFAWSVHQANVSPASGYFVTTTRIWELGVGGILATAVGLRGGRSASPRLGSGPLRAAIMVVAAAAICWAAYTYSGATPFPGWRAAIPVLGTVVLIGIGSAVRPTLPDRLLTLPPARFLGDISYSVYLWHWPMIVLLPYVSGGELGLLDKLTIIAATLVLSTLTKKYVEDRFRSPGAGWRAPTLRTVGLAAAGMAVLVAGMSVQLAEVDHREEASLSAVADALADGGPCVGANAMAPSRDCPVTRTGKVVPDPSIAINDISDVYARDCRESPPYAGLRTCTYGDPNGKVDIAVVGNSHMIHWMPAIDRIAKASGWKVTTYLLSMCSPNHTRNVWSSKETGDGCHAWGQRLLKAVDEHPYDLVVMSNSSGGRAEGADNRAESIKLWTKGYERYIGDIVKSGSPVMVIRDTPFPKATDIVVPDCVAEHRDDLTKCSGARGTWLRDDPLADAAKQVTGASVADLTDYLCTVKTCPGVIGGIIVYFDAYHLTATYSQSLAPYLATPLEAAVKKSLARKTAN